jgi:monoamine oxidase
MSCVRGLVVVGGGAAGIGAASEARARGIDALIVEAKDRLGGRAHSIDWNGYQLDLGCTWMHSAERNSLRVEAERIGAAIDRASTNWAGQFRNLGFSREEQEDAWAAFQQLEERMRSAPPASDRASDVLEPSNPWNAFLNAISSYINGAPLDEVSVADWLAYDNASSDQNLRLPRGYGGLLSSLGASFEHRLGNAVTAVSRFKDSVRVETDDGVIEAERVVVTVPTSMLHRIRFDPSIEGLFETAEQLPLGVADKLFLALEEPEEFPHGAHLLGNPRSAETGSYFIRPMGIPVIEGFFGGPGARALEELGDEDAAAVAADELAQLLGSGIRKRLTPIALSRWAAEPWVEGSYSHALPGHTIDRVRLASAGDDRIALAGEAVSTSDYSTAHGAYDSGVAAVRRLFGRSTDGGQLS